MLWGTERKARMAIFSLVYVAVGVPIYPWVKRTFNLSYIPSRKYFHLNAFVLFAPSFIYEVSLTFAC